MLSSHRASSPIRLEWLVMRIDVAHLYFVKKIDLNKDKKAGRKRNMHSQNNIGWDVEKDAKHQKLAKKETQIMFNSFQSINDPVLFFHIHFRMKSAWRKKKSTYQTKANNNKEKGITTYWMGEDEKN